MSGSPAQPEREGETEKRTAGGIPADDYSRKVKRLLIQHVGTVPPALLSARKSEHGPRSCFGGVTTLSTAMDEGMRSSLDRSKAGVPAMHKSFGRPSGPRSSFGSRVDFEARGHSTLASSKAYSEFTLPHPLLRSRTPFALPPRDYTPSTQRAAQVYSARARNFDEGARTGPQIAVHFEGWGRPCSVGFGERGKFRMPSRARHGSSCSLPPGALCGWLWVALRTLARRPPLTAP